MSLRFDSDAIDEACLEMFGHTNWAYADSATEEQLKEDHTTVVFFHEPDAEAKDE